MTDPDGPSIPASVQDAAAEWLARRQADAGAQVERAFADWLNADPRHRIAYEQVARDWQDSLVLADSPVGRSRKLGRAPFLMRHSTHVGAASLGLAAIVGVATVGLVRHGSPFELVSPAEAATYRTAIGEIRTIRLSDGSSVTLDTATLVRVSFTAGQRRLDLAQGRARFHVAPDRQRPFAVDVPGGEILARSTLFDVSLVDAQPTISALEGSVELRSSTPDTPVRTQALAAGEKAVLGSHAGPEPASAAEAQWVSGMLALDATPLGNAVATINRYNRIQVRFSDPHLARLLVTGAFRAREPDEFARGIAATFDLGIDRSDPDILLLKPGQPDVLPPR